MQTLQKVHAVMHLTHRRGNMVYCFAFGCNHQSLREHCKFFRFPLKDAVLLEQWKSASKRGDREPNQYDRLCSCHFNDGRKENGLTMFTSEKKVHKVKKETIEPAEDEEIEEKPQIALTPAGPPVAPSAAPPAVPPTSTTSQRIAMRRKRMRIDFVSFGLHNGKLKRLAPNPNPAGKIRKISNSLKAKLHAHVSRTSSHPPPPPSPPAVEPPAPRVRMTRDQINWIRMIDRIRCLAFREARDAGANFISVRWVANCLNRSPAFVKKHWRGRYQDCVPPTVVTNSMVSDSEGEEEEWKAKEEEGEEEKVKKQGGEGDIEVLHDDWDPILEERNVIEGMLKPEPAEQKTVQNGGTEAAEEGRNMQLNINIPVDDSKAAIPIPRRNQQRGKVTPKIRTDSALAEKNVLAEDEDAEEENTPLKCLQCGRKFSNAVNLERHIRLHGISVGPFVCPQCGSVFAKRRGLVRHLRVHSGEPRYVCETCGKGFAQLTNLEKHRRLHTGERAYACLLCDRKFMEQEHLTSHMLQHSGERPYSCDFCDKRFKMQCHLVSHLRSHVPPLLAAKNASS